MAVVVLNSDLLSDVPLGRRNNPANRSGAGLCINRFTIPALTAAADIGSIIRVCTLPNNARLLLGLSKVAYSAGGTSAALGFGTDAYRGSNGELVPASPLFFGSAFNVVAAGTGFLDTLTTPLAEWEAPADVVLTMTVAGANLPIGFTLAGGIVYAASFVGPQ